MNKPLLLNVFVLSVLLTIIFISVSSMPFKIFLAVFSSLFFIPVVRDRLIKRMIAIAIACPAATLIYFFGYWLISSSDRAGFDSVWGEMLLAMWITFFIYIAVGIPYSMVVDYVARILELKPRNAYFLRLVLYGLAAVLLALLLGGAQIFIASSLYVYSYFHILLYVEKKIRRNAGA